MKKKSILVIAIVAIVAIAASVSFAAWNAITNASGNMDVNIAKTLNLDVTSAKVDNGDVLVPSGEIIEAKDVTYTAEKTIGTFTAKFYDAKDSSKINVDSSTHDIILTVTNLDELLQITFEYGDSNTPIVAKDGKYTIPANTEITVKVKFIDDASTIDTTKAGAVAGTVSNITLNFDAVAKA